ncbi:ATP synthase subunit delta [Plasmodium brasilianum]|uniref:Mitochondrial ATP synthase delta subunit, putative n=2 Tax=Plasmodium (Plasmodium) TaxID=418103 RepID=A0A1A8W4C9_PLAMA|nr:mitochondrial ATP synthase delta subunit, putative [Plasmodium malariae]KAI4838580.1 ATP synthase subunit delta [Plasmodium brasilianum]SBS86011.1 mitochondrial ATP synthase delta subunit, putative [Plasmodium malariae]SCN12990.1 mitochondrial ATP synthase delta subunit, putative [Plasmodium malariae]
MLNKARRIFFSTAKNSNLYLTISSSSESIFRNQVIKRASFPGIEGYFTITNNHSPLVTLLRNGIITVEFDEKEKKQFFISDGIFIYKKSNDSNNGFNAEIVGVEIVPLEYLDKNKTVKVLQQMCAINDATDDKWRQIKTMLGKELCSSILRIAS